MNPSILTSQKYRTIILNEMNSINKMKILFLVFLISLNSCLASAKLMTFGDKLPNLIEEHPNKSWLIKFYAPWCYHCQQLEPTFNNVAERIYHKHDDLIVGRVDCSKYGHICNKYDVKSYPTIIYLNKNTHISYKGDRSLESLVDFADRLSGPDVRVIDNCHDLREAINRHGLVILSNQNNASDILHKEFISLASTLKSNYWFHHIKIACKDLIEKPGLYILKRHLNKGIEYMYDSSIGDLRKSIIDWISQESFPIYGPITGMNIDRSLTLDKMIVLAVLDEYKPAKKFSQTSHDFHKIVEKFVKRYIQKDDQILFGWSSDLDLIQSIIVGQISVPNLVLLKSDYSYHLLVKEHSKSEKEILENFNEQTIKQVIAAAKSGNLVFSGGNNILFKIMRFCYKQYITFTTMYKANPLLATVLIALPSIVVLFVIYTTCCYDGPGFNDDTNEENSDDERQNLLNHSHQD